MFATNHIVGDIILCERWIKDHWRAVLNFFGLRSNVQENAGLATVALIPVHIILLLIEREVLLDDFKRLKHLPARVRRFEMAGLVRELSYDFDKPSAIELGQESYVILEKRMERLLGRTEVTTAESFRRFHEFTMVSLADRLANWAKLHPHLDRLKRGRSLARIDPEFKDSSSKEDMLSQFGYFELWRSQQPKVS